jgi:hypothetical protein
MTAAVTPGSATLLAQVASIICAETCGLTSECKSREVAKALFDKGYLRIAAKPDEEGNPVEPEELESLIADRSANRAADAILANYVLTRRSPTEEPKP